MRIAVVGAGIGGLALAGFLLRRADDAPPVEVTLYEQARAFERVGAGIQMSPNAVRVLRALGLEDRLRAAGFTPPSWTNRAWDSGEHLGTLTFGAEAEARYGAPYLLLHRGDLHQALFDAMTSATGSGVPVVRFGHRLEGIESAAGGGLRLRFAHGAEAEADAVVGADGVHSRVRGLLFGPERPTFTGRVAHRTTFPAERLAPGTTVTTCTKWWGPDRHIVIYPVEPRGREVYFVTSVPDPAWDTESWSARGTAGEVLDAFTGFHPEVQGVLGARPEIHKWALFERAPMPAWGEGPVVLLGDACHPMTPYMAQGAASALEDAAVLARGLAAEPTDPAAAFARYQATRQERTARIQLTSRQNQWGRSSGDPAWVYGYDALTTPLAPAAGAA